MTHASDSRKPLRLWPGVAAALIIVLARFAMPAIVPWTFIYGLMAGLACSVLIALWWLFFSRAPWVERIGAIVLMVAAVFVTSFFVHRSIENAMMGLMLRIYSVPALAVALVAALVLSRERSAGFRRAAIAVAIVMASGVFAILRTDGITGDSGSQLAWRWTPTPEERLLAQGQSDPVAATPAPAEVKPAPATAPTDPARATDPSKLSQPPAATAPATSVSGAASPAPSAPPSDPKPAEWPGFRGPQRDSVVRRIRIDTDWEKSPPVEVWRRPVGPGWSSFSVQGDRIYTQEQRGDHEIVACYSASTGAPVWMHRDQARFYESNGGAGPRGTPTVDRGRVYALGATGIVNALDARDGRRRSERRNRQDRRRRGRARADDPRPAPAARSGRVPPIDTSAA